MSQVRTLSTDEKAEPKNGSPLQLATADEVARAAEDLVHKFEVNKQEVICKTETKGRAMPKGRTPAEIVLDASYGFIPLWARGVTLRWRFQESSMIYFKDPSAAKQYLRSLLGRALLLWGDAAPVRFSERDDAWDFEVVMQPKDDGQGNSYVLASAFFPDGGQHELSVYPAFFKQSDEEQVETLIHELGHVFGLRHFFADIREREWRSEIFGTHNPFSIMNYGNESKLTAADKSDLARLYELAWSNRLTHINGTPIRLFQPFSSIGSSGLLSSLVPADLAERKCPCCYRAVAPPGYSEFRGQQSCLTP